MRSALAVALGALTMSLGAVMLGEYELTGFTPFVAAVLFAMAIGEVVGTVSGRRSTAVAVAAGALAGVGLVWAAWIQAGRDWSYVPGPTWVSVGVGVAFGFVWVRSSARRGGHTPPDPPPPPAG